MIKIAVSNLAWRKSEDEKVFEIMRDLNVLNWKSVHLETGVFYRK